MERPDFPAELSARDERRSSTSLEQPVYELFEKIPSHVPAPQDLLDPSDEASVRTWAVWIHGVQGHSIWGSPEDQRQFFKEYNAQLKELHGPA